MFSHTRILNWWRQQNTLLSLTTDCSSWLISMYHRFKFGLHIYIYIHLHWPIHHYTLNVKGVIVQNWAFRRVHVRNSAFLAVHLMRRRPASASPACSSSTMSLSSSLFGADWPWILVYCLSTTVYIKLVCFSKASITSSLLAWHGFVNNTRWLLSHEMEIKNKLLVTFCT